MIHASLNFANVLGKAAIERKKIAMAETLLRQTYNRIWDGGDDDYRFPPLDYPRPDGSTANPLYHTGLHLLPSIHSFVRPGEFGVGSRFIGAKVLLKGTVGKGGSLPSIRPVNALALFIPMSTRGQSTGPVKGGGSGLKRGVDFRFAQKVDIRPRQYFRLSRLNRHELIQTFAKA